MLEASHISYNNNGKTILKDVSCSFSIGTLSVIVGPNGAGKSTLIKILSGLHVRTEGSVFYGERSVQNIAPRDLAKIRSVLSQDFDTVFDLKVKEIVLMGRSPHFSSTPSSKDFGICYRAMDYFQVSDLADRLYQSLSGGEKQKVLFAKVLSQIWSPEREDIKYLFLDEPLTFLDVRYQLEFMEKLRSLIKDFKLVVVAVVHDLNLAARYADKVIILDKGSVYHQGTARESLTAGHIKNVFGLDAELVDRGTTFSVLYH